MGNNQSGTQPLKMMQMSCQDDLMCQNIDSRRSVPGKTPVLVCPDAKCVSGKCVCGDNCERDPYTGMCCTEVEERKVNTPQGEYTTTFCIEEPTEIETFSGKGSLGFRSF